jgi:hypothetical protein
MPARSSYVCCSCTQCLTSDPAGKQFPATRPKPHLAGVQAQRNQAAQLELLTEDMDIAGTHTLALTVTDNGPDFSSQPSRLWTSHDHFQQD